MESKSRVHIQPLDAPQPRQAIKPMATALRWDSPYDNEGFKPNVTVYVTQSAYARICVHAASEPDIETGGVMIGEWCADADTGEHFIVVEHALPARYTVQGSIYLTFTQDTLVDIHAKIDERYQGKQIVGWYHTHPKMGVFLSHYDTWLHNHFFPEPWQVALVVEPHTDLGGFFIRQTEFGLDPSRYFGFFEMDGSRGGSIVNWRNLRHIWEDGKEAG